MNKSPLDFFKNNDAELLANITSTRELAFKEGALPLKEKLLIALALDASHGAANGVKTLAKQAVEAGATKEEIMDVLRVTYYIDGVGSMFTSALALDELF